MSTFHLVIVSPDGNMYDGDAQGLFLRGSEGDLAVMAGHIPFITSVKPCTCKVQINENEERTADIKSGLLTVSQTGTTLLSGDFKWE